MLTSVSAEKMTSQQRKALEKSGKKHKAKTKLWVKVNDKGSKTKRGKWAGNATFQWKGEDEKHGEEIPLRTGDVLKLKGKDLWVHPKHGDPFKFGEDEPEAEEPEAEEPEDEAEADEDEEAADEDEAEDEPPPKPKKKPKAKKPEPEEDDEATDEDDFSDEEGAGPLTEEEIAAEDEAEAIAAEEEKLKLRKQALAAEKTAKKAAARAQALRAQVGGKLAKQVEDEGVEKTSKSVAGKLVGLAGKLALKGFVRSLFFLGGAIKGGGKALKELGPAIKNEIASERKKLAEAQKAGISDIIDADFKVLETNLKAVDDDKWLLGPAPEEKSKKAAPAPIELPPVKGTIEAAVHRLHTALLVSAGFDGDVNSIIKKSRMDLDEQSSWYSKQADKATDPEQKKAFGAARDYLDKIIYQLQKVERFSQTFVE